jgi:type II secretory pathway component PulK
MRRRGVVLVAVLVVTAMLALIAAGVLFRLRAEVAASAAQERGEQAYEAALAGVEFAVAVLKSAPADMALWDDNPEIFLNQFVADDGANRWYFTVYADAPPEQDVPRYGVTDEAGKLNVNVAPEEALAALEPLTTELLDCLLDYRDADSETRSEGAEQDYYDGLPQPYVIPNGPLSTLEELLVIKGFTGAVVCGEDANLNGILDPNEDDGDESFPPDDRDGRLDHGLRGLLTVYGSEPNVDARGRPRVDLNGDLPRNLGLPEDTLRFIAVYKAEGNRFTHPSQLLEMRYEAKQDHQDMGNIRRGQTVESGVASEQLPAILDRLTTGPTGERARLTGLLNVNTASAEVLAALPGIETGLAQQIVDVRKDLDPALKTTPAWLYTQNLMEADAFKDVAPLLTARSYQFRVRCVGFGIPCGRYRVLEAVVDFGGSAPRIAYLRDITRLGLPMALDPEFVERSR